MHVGQVIAERVRSARDIAGLTQQQLADRCDELGHPISRVTIAKIEGGAKDKPRSSDYLRAMNLTVTEVLVLAAALDVPPVLMFVPLGDVESVQLGGVEMHPHLMFEWIAGDEPFSTLPDNRSRRFEAWRGNAAVIASFRALRQQQNRAGDAYMLLGSALEWEAMDAEEREQLQRFNRPPDVQESQAAFDREIAALVNVRERMRAHRISLPDLPTEWQSRLAELRLMEGVES